MGLGDYYLVAKSPNDAEMKLKTLLDAADYGFRENRKVENIRLLSEEVEALLSNIPIINKSHRLILETTCT